MPKRSSSWLLAAMALAIATAAAAAPAGHHPQRGESGSVLRVRGDQVSTEDLVDAVARAYADTRAGRLAVQPFNTIDGIDQALAGTVDIAASARPAYPARAQEAGLTFTPVAWDALVLITNASNPVPNLTLRQVHAIYYGRITNWSQVGGPDERIDLEGVFPKLDGIQFSFRRLMFGNGDNPVAVPRLLINVDSLQADVALNPRALALSTLAHVRHQRGIRIIPIEGVAPSLATLADGSYPLPVKLFLAYRADSPKLAAIRNFLAFLGGNRAGGILRDHGLLPYARAGALNARSEKDRIDAIGARMVAEGLPAAYAPGNEFARLARQYPGLEQSGDAQPDASQPVGVNVQTAAPAPAAVYTVASGDTLVTIARKHSVSVAELRKWNHLHGNALQVGQELKVATSNP